MTRRTVISQACARRSTVAIGMVGVLVLAGCNNDRDPDQPVEEKPFDIGSIEEGEEICLNFDDTVGPEVFALPTVPCDVPHSHEIYAVATYEPSVEGQSRDVYPGFDELENFARRTCLSEFEDFVKSNPFDSRLFHSWLVPTLDGWTDEEEADREIICVLGDQKGKPLTRSMRNSGE
jgi:hypothetical protein